MKMTEALLKAYDEELYEGLEPSVGALGRLRRALVGEWAPVGDWGLVEVAGAGEGAGREPLLLREDGFWRQGGKSGTWEVADLDGDVIVRVDEGKVAIGIECCDQGITVRAGGEIVAGRYRR
jgi:hypothetical protein